MLFSLINYFRLVLEESGLDGSECCRKGEVGEMLLVRSGRLRMLGIYNLTVQGYCTRVCLMYGSEVML